MTENMKKFIDESVDWKEMFVNSQRENKRLETQRISLLSILTHLCKDSWCRLSPENCGECFNCELRKRLLSLNVDKFISDFGNE